MADEINPVVCATCGQPKAPFLFTPSQLKKPCPRCRKCASEVRGQTFGKRDVTGMRKANQLTDSYTRLHQMQREAKDQETQALLKRREERLKEKP